LQVHSGVRFNGTVIAVFNYAAKANAAGGGSWSGLRDGGGIWPGEEPFRLLNWSMGKTITIPM
jgi:hypothetical protein